jgi:hypothetical protein
VTSMADRARDTLWAAARQIWSAECRADGTPTRGSISSVAATGFARGRGEPDLVLYSSRRLGCGMGTRSA